jgi:hypothetical protein
MNRLKNKLYNKYKKDDISSFGLQKYIKILVFKILICCNLRWVEILAIQIKMVLYQAF